jgi:hypothetical protein
MTDDELRKLAEAALADDAKATPGPWMVEKDWTFEVVATGDQPGLVGKQVLFGDARVIAAARTREPKLARAVLRLLEERNTWKERAETWQEQEMMNPGEWKLRQAIVEAAVEWAHTPGPAPADLGPLLDAINDWQDAKAQDRRIDSPDSPPAESKL